MNHFKTGNAFFAQGSYKSNKYNSKELQETGLYSYGWREYMPDIGKWNGIDQLAESYLSASPYAYVLNNPINMFDPDGRETAPWSAMWEATPDGTNSYWFNDGRGFTSYDGGGGGGSLPYSSHVSYGGAFTMGDWTYALPPIIIKGQGTASTWNMGSNYLPNILAMGMAFNQSLASWKYQNGGSTVSFSPVMHNGSAYMMGGDMFGFTDLLGVLLSSIKPENREAAMGLAAIAVITTKGRAAPAILKTELAIEKAEIYSVAFEMKLAKSSYPGVYRGGHFREANKALEAVMKSDTKFAASMDELGIVIPRSPAGSILGKSPKNWVWHHHVDEGVMQLVPKPQHTVGSSFWSTMHPGNKGGFSIWGK